MTHYSNFEVNNNMAQKIMYGFRRLNSYVSTGAFKVLLSSYKKKIIKSTYHLLYIVITNNNISANAGTLIHVDAKQKSLNKGRLSVRYTWSMPPIFIGVRIAYFHLSLRVCACFLVFFCVCVWFVLYFVIVSASISVLLNTFLKVIKDVFNITLSTLKN